MVDELGKGTSTREGVGLCGAVLEHLDQLGSMGFFATHLHELFDMGLKLKSTVYKKMGFYKDPNKSKWLIYAIILKIILYMITMYVFFYVFFNFCKQT